MNFTKAFLYDVDRPSPTLCASVDSHQLSVPGGFLKWTCLKSFLVLATRIIRKRGPQVKKFEQVSGLAYQTSLAGEVQGQGRVPVQGERALRGGSLHGDSYVVMSNAWVMVMEPL